MFIKTQLWQILILSKFFISSAERISLLEHQKLVKLFRVAFMIVGQGAKRVLKEISCGLCGTTNWKIREIFPKWQKFSLGWNETHLENLDSSKCLQHKNFYISIRIWWWWMILPLFLSSCISKFHFFSEKLFQFNFPL